MVRRLSASTIPTTSRAATSRSSLTTVTSNSGSAASSSEALASRPRICRLDLPGALDVDLDQDVAALGQGPGDRLPRRAVPLAEDVGPLQEPAGLDHLVELAAVDEVVVAAFVLPRPRPTGGGRDGQLQVGQGGQKPGHDRALADPRGAGEDDQLPPPTRLLVPPTIGQREVLATSCRRTRRAGRPSAWSRGRGPGGRRRCRASP